MFEKIRDALVSQLEVDPDIITRETNIIDDLGADSLDIIELIMELEEEYGLVITDESIHEFQTVGEIADFIEGLL